MIATQTLAKLNKPHAVERNLLSRGLGVDKQNFVPIMRIPLLSRMSGS